MIYLYGLIQPMGVRNRVNKENVDDLLDDKKIGKVIFSSFLYNYYSSTYINAAI